MDSKKLQELNQALETLIENQRYNQIEKFFPETGPYSRYNYPKQMDFFEKTRFHTVMGLLGANGSGKTTLGALLTYWHASGKYPKWWSGYKFDIGGIPCWVIGKSTKQLDAIQDALFGSYLDIGTGIIPKHEIIDHKSMPGANDRFGLVYLRHYNSFGKEDGTSRIEFKTAEQGFEQLQGSNIKWIWGDEDPEDGRILSECLARTRPGTEGVAGRLLWTFTPTAGWSDTYLLFLPEGKLPQNGINPENPNLFTMVLGNDQAHMTAEWKLSQHYFWLKTDPQNILARETGMAKMGSGKIYPVDEDFFVIKRFKIPTYFRRAFGLDFASSVGQTACVWVAEDPSTKRKYIYAEYKNDINEHPHDSLHILRIKAKGDWIPGACDPHSGRRDGGELRADYYRSLGLNLQDGESNPQAGIAMIYSDLQNGQLQIMEDCAKILTEMRTYRWDPKNPSKPAEKQDDHLLDALRYAYSKFDYIARSEEDEFRDNSRDDYKDYRKGCDPLTGY